MNLWTFYFNIYLINKPLEMSTIVSVSSPCALTPSSITSKLSDKMKRFGIYINLFCFHLQTQYTLVMNVKIHLRALWIARLHHKLCQSHALLKLKILPVIRTSPHKTNLPTTHNSNIHFIEFTFHHDYTNYDI